MATAATFDLTSGEAAELIGVHQDTIKKWAAAGQVPGWRTPGGHWRFSTDQLTQWLEERAS